MIQQGTCASFILELYQGIHDFTSDTLMVALYDHDTADLSPDTTAYTTAGEVSDASYDAGGKELALADGTPALDGRTLRITFDPVTWSAASFDCGGALIYNASKANRAVCVINMGRIHNTGGDFILPWPSPLGELRAFQVA